MPHLIIGHTTDRTACIWVRGSWFHRTCTVRVAPRKAGVPQPRPVTIRVSRSHDYTGTADITGLVADREYDVSARFSLFGIGASRPLRGRFQTFHHSGQHRDFSFVLSSCNLSVVTINNLLSRLIAAAGTSAAITALDLTPDRLQVKWLSFLREPLRATLKLVAWSIDKLTNLKQPPPPYLRSPFLKLWAVFDAHLVEVIAPKEWLPAAGDVVRSYSGGRGVVASSAAKVDLGNGVTPPTWRLVLTQCEEGGPTFTGGETLAKVVRHPSGDDTRPIGTIAGARAASPWYERPAFFIHAGDQIYYDIPTEDLRPDREMYRRAYREAFFDDYASRYLLAHSTHYMVWDDHDIADQFAVDFNPPNKKTDPCDYLREANVAYREYVQARNPRPLSTGSHWYRFSHGCTRFFVLDTRSRRRIGESPQIIDDDQLRELLAWMDEYPNDLKFVVTSVPFVAEVREGNDERRPDKPSWNRNRKPGNPLNDKWNAPPFRIQRGRIISHIFQRRVKHLVFITGDMHCCYQATMRIGPGRKYECVTIHELAGGPANQLQLADPREFHMRRTAYTPGGLRYEVVMDQFHTQVNAVLHLKVKQYQMRPEVEWNVIRTLTDTGALAWSRNAALARLKRYVSDADNNTVRIEEPVMAGRITFTAH